MANAIYPKWKEAVIQATSNSSLGGTVKACLVDTGVYTYSSSHEFVSDLSTARLGTDQTLGSKTFTNGTFDSADPTWTALTATSVEAIVLYVDTGVAGTSRLVAYLDTSQTGLPFTPTGGNYTYQVSASGWFTI